MVVCELELEELLEAGATELEELDGIALELLEEGTIDVLPLVGFEETG